jgi:hypothetical protein
MPEDDPYVIHEMLVEEIKSEAFVDLENNIQMKFFELVEIYRMEIEKIEAAKLQFEQQMAMMGAPPPEGEGGG